MNQREALTMAVAYIGSRDEFSEELGITVQALGQWINHGLPPGRALEIHELTKVNLKSLLGE